MSGDRYIEDDRRHLKNEKKKYRYMEIFGDRFTLRGFFHRPSVEQARSSRCRRDIGAAAAAPRGSRRVHAKEATKSGGPRRQREDVRSFNEERASKRDRKPPLHAIFRSLIPREANIRIKLDAKFIFVRTLPLSLFLLLSYKRS